MHACMEIADMQKLKTNSEDDHKQVSVNQPRINKAKKKEYDE